MITHLTQQYSKCCS